MRNQGTLEFQARLDRINQSCSNGETRRKRRRVHISWLRIVLIFAVFVGLKTTLILVESESILESRVQNLTKDTAIMQYKDTAIMQYAVKLLQPDPVTHWIATILKDLI